jgi:hypothetical protein
MSNEKMQPASVPEFVDDCGKGRTRYLGTCSAAEVCVIGELMSRLTSFIVAGCPAPGYSMLEATDALSANSIGHLLNIARDCSPDRRKLIKWYVLYSQDEQYPLGEPERGWPQMHPELCVSLGKALNNICLHDLVRPIFWPATRLRMQW